MDLEHQYKTQKEIKKSVQLHENEENRFCL